MDDTTNATGVAPQQGRLQDPPANGSRKRRKDTARLVWDSKPKRPPSPRDIEFQTAEIVLPNPVRDEKTLPFGQGSDVFTQGELDKRQMNRLIWGDNLLAMQALLAQGYEGQVDLIYIDPPFDSKSDYSYGVSAGDVNATKEASLLERLAYSDMWSAGSDSYIDSLYPAIHLMKRLLSDSGSIYVHVGWQVSHYVRILLEEIFGRDNFVNEIIWKRGHAHSDAKQGTKHLGRIHESIFLFQKSDDAYFNQMFTPYEKAYIEKYYSRRDENGRRYWLDNLQGPGGGKKGNPRYEVMGVTRYWRYSEKRMQELIEQGRIVQTTPGTVPKYKRYLDEMPGRPIQDMWSDVKSLGGLGAQVDERTGFPTQKPEKLLERIVNTSSPEGGLVADFFSGSGTTLAVAEKLGRRWIGCDFGKVGIQVARGRLVEQDAKPFLIENIGNYQREMIYLQGGRIWEMQRVILKLYGAEPHPDRSDLGIRRTEEGGGGDELVHVGYPDRPTTAKKAAELARMAAGLDGGYRRLTLLAWDYDYDFDAAWQQHAGDVKVEVAKKLIPPDIYDYLKKAKDEAKFERLAEKVQFHEKPYLKLATPTRPTSKDGAVTVGIERYTVFDFPVKKDEDKAKLRKLPWAALIDYWAVDWDYDGRTFKSRWQAIRGNGKKARTVPTTSTSEGGVKVGGTVAVRVVDIFGNDAAGTVTV